MTGLPYSSSLPIWKLTLTPLSFSMSVWLIHLIFHWKYLLGLTTLILTSTPLVPLACMNTVDLRQHILPWPHQAINAIFIEHNIKPLLGASLLLPSICPFYLIFKNFYTS